MTTEDDVAVRLFDERREEFLKVFREAKKGFRYSIMRNPVDEIWGLSIEDLENRTQEFRPFAFYGDPTGCLTAYGIKSMEHSITVRSPGDLFDDVMATVLRVSDSESAQ